MLNYDRLTSTMTVRELIETLQDLPDWETEVQIITPGGIFSIGDVLGNVGTNATYIRGWDKRD